VDDEGRVQFGADVYGYDEAYFAGALPVEEAKEYKAASARGL
jgi:murein L,D-transpeptidase YcbB/YkuD